MFWVKIAKTRRMIVTDVFSAKGAVQLLAWGIAPGFDYPYDKALKARFSVQSQT
jgi:hypothetical protein